MIPGSWREPHGALSQHPERTEQPVLALPPAPRPGHTVPPSGGTQGGGHKVTLPMFGAAVVPDTKSHEDTESCSSHSSSGNFSHKQKNLGREEVEKLEEQAPKKAEFQSSHFPCAQTFAQQENSPGQCWAAGMARPASPGAHPRCLVPAPGVHSRGQCRCPQHGPGTLQGARKQPSCT